MLTRGQIDPWTWTDCKLGIFLFEFGKQYSSMLLVLMSVEKCFAVYFPLKSKTVCTVKTAKWATGMTGVILMGYNLQWFFFVKSKYILSPGHYICVATEYFHDSINFVDPVLYSFVPFALMFVTNFAIVLKFMTAKCNQRNSTESTNQALSKAATRGTAMVVAVSVTFLFLTAPTAVHFASYTWYQLGNNPLYQVFMNLTQYLNHSINGVLYTIVGSRFKNELIKLFSRKKKI